jgi:hypothetical protein
LVAEPKRAVNALEAEEERGKDEGQKQLKTRQGEHRKKGYIHAHWVNHTLTTKHQSRKTTVSSPTTFINT